MKWFRHFGKGKSTEARRGDLVPVAAAPEIGSAAGSAVEQKEVETPFPVAVEDWRRFSLSAFDSWQVPPVYKDLLQADGGILIAGATGSGKSVQLGGIIDSVLKTYFPAKCAGVVKAVRCAEVYLCDPKIVEFRRWQSCPQVRMYADSWEYIRAALDEVIYTMNQRYQDMANRGLRKWDGSKVFVFIDEIGDLMLCYREEFLPRLTKLMNLCRAAGITVFLATQSPSRLTIPACIQLNATAKVALRCDSQIESRQIIGEAGAEKLPAHGECIYKTPATCGTKRATLPYITDKEIAHTIHILLEQSAYAKGF